MVEGRDAEEDVVVGLAVVLLLHLGRLREAVVLEDDGLREAGRARGEVDGRVIVEADLDARGARRAVGDEGVVGLGEGRAVAAHVEAHPDLRHPLGDVLHAAGELGPEDEDGGVGEVEAVADLIGRVAVVEGDGHRAGAEDAEVDGEPLQAVHEEDGDLVALPHVPREEEVGEAVRLLVELRPRHLAAEGLDGARLDERILLPRRVAGFEFLRVDFDQGDLVREFPRILREDFGYDFHDITILD